MIITLSSGIANVDEGIELDKEMKSPIAELVKDISKQHDIIFACQKGDINNHLTNINYIG